MRYKIGDIYQVDLGTGSFGYMQYVGDDSTNLNSSVVRVLEFQSTATNPDLKEIVDSSIILHVHLDLYSGVREGLWQRFDYSEIDEIIEPRFLGTKDVGQVKYSKQWRTWKMSKPDVFLGELPAEYYYCDIGIIFDPWSIVKIVHTNIYPCTYSLPWRRPRKGFDDTDTVGFGD